MESPRRSRSPWPLVFVISFLALLGAMLYVFQSLRAVPGDVVESGREVLHDLERIAEAFHRGTVTTSFLSYATEVSGSNYLQFATLKQVEVFERKDSAATFWGALELPDVVVEARAPVEYTYYLDLNGEWRFTLDGLVVRVLAPPIEFNSPAIDASAIRYEVRAGSILRNEAAALEKLREGLTEASRRRARENIVLVRELGRKKTIEFTEKWLTRSFTDAPSHRVELRFADEVRRPEEKF
jgi:hypothetical protein